MLYSTTDILTALLEMAEPNYKVPDSQRIRSFFVDYYAISPSGSRARFQRGASLNLFNFGRSETAVYNWLRSKHPRCDIQIQRLEWR